MNDLDFAYYDDNSIDDDWDRDYYDSFEIPEVTEEEKTFQNVIAYEVGQILHGDNIDFHIGALNQLLDGYDSYQRIYRNNKQ